MKKKLVIGIVVVAVIAMNFAIMLGNTNWNQGTQTPEISHHIFPKANHGVIRINSDSDFTWANGVVSGSGSVSSPYKISGWTIDGGGKGIAIYIGNTTKNFTIENCELFNATGGNFDTYHQNAGITIYSAKASDIYIQTNTIHDNKGAGIVITHTTVSEKLDIGVPGVGNSINRIYSNGRAGVYSSSTTNIVVTYNNIWSNYNGVQFGSVDTFTITWNGIGENTHYGIYLSGAKNGNIYSNVIYDNNGSKDYYDSSRVQAYQYDSSNINWYDTSSKNGNYWHDWAQNNDTNYDRAHNNFVIPWPFKFTGAQDPYPMKGVHHVPIYINTTANPDVNNSFNIGTGVVEGVRGYYNGYDDYYYEVLGWEIDGGSSGYGVYLNDIKNPPSLDIHNLIVHNVTSASGATQWEYKGNGIVLKDLGDSPINVYEITEYGCEHNGFAISNTSWLEIYGNWIYHNDVGIYITGTYSYPDISGCTVDSNTHWGMYVDASHSWIRLGNTIFQKNTVGVLVPDGVNDTGMKIEESSFFMNTHYGLQLGKNTNSTIAVVDNIFYHNNGAGDTYDPSHLQIYADDHSNFTNYDEDSRWIGTGNYYHDWVNDKTVSGNTYPIAGGILADEVQEHVDFMYYYVSLDDHLYEPIYVNSTNINYLRDWGTDDGIVGYDSGTYYIVGWHNTKNYTNSWGINYGIYVHGDGDKSFTISNVHINNTGYGIDVWNTYSATVKNSVVENNKYVGIWEEYNQWNLIEYNRVLNNNYAGIDVQGESFFTDVYENRVYMNQADGIDLEAVSSSGWGILVSQNYVFGNRIGLNASSISDTFIENNGFAWNHHYGVELYNSNGNYIYNNTFYMNNGSFDSYRSGLRQAYDYGTNYWNDSHYGNYWLDWANNNDTNDQNYDWIVDYPYHVYGGNSEDEYPYLYRSHDVTRIDSINDIDWDHGFVAGDGEHYPYLMTGLKFNGNNHDYGIYVGNISGNAEMRFDYVLVASVSTGDVNNDYHSGSGIIIYNFAGWDFQIYDSSSGYNYNDGIDIIKSGSVEMWNSYFEGNSYEGVYIIDGSHGITVSETNASGNGWAGIYASGSQNILVEYSNDVSKKIYKNDYGVIFYQVSTGEITENNISQNTHYGVKLMSSSDVKVYKNIFYENNGSSGDGTYDSKHIQAYDDESTEYTNYWNTTTVGNCWSDWDQSTPYQLDPGPNYVAKDHKPGCGFVPELNMVIIIFAMLGVIALSIYRRKH